MNSYDVFGFLLDHPVDAPAGGVAIGVITGELTAITVWIIIALLAAIPMPYITIDRYRP